MVSFTAKNADTFLNDQLKKDDHLEIFDFLLEFAITFYPIIPRSTIEVCAKLLDKQNANKFIVNRSTMVEYGVIFPMTKFVSMRIKLRRLGFVKDADWVAYSTSKSEDDKEVSVTPRTFILLIQNCKRDNETREQFYEDYLRLKKAVSLFEKYKYAKAQSQSMGKRSQIKILEQKLSDLKDLNCILMEENFHLHKYISTLKQTNESILNENKILFEKLYPEKRAAE